MREMRAEPELADQHDFVALRDRPGGSTTTRPTRTTSRSSGLRRPERRRDSARIDRCRRRDRSGPVEHDLGRRDRTDRDRPSPCLLRDDALGRGFEIEGGGEQRARVGALRRLEQFGGRAGLHHLAVAASP